MLNINHSCLCFSHCLSCIPGFGVLGAGSAGDVAAGRGVLGVAGKMCTQNLLSYRGLQCDSSLDLRAGSLSPHCNQKHPCEHLGKQVRRPANSRTLPHSTRDPKPYHVFSYPLDEALSANVMSVADQELPSKAHRFINSQTQNGRPAITDMTRRLKLSYLLYA